MHLGVCRLRCYGSLSCAVVQPLDVDTSLGVTGFCCCRLTRHVKFELLPQFISEMAGDSRNRGYGHRRGLKKTAIEFLG